MSSTVLSGSVAVCVDRPILSLDRPFTYELPDELEAGIGSLVQVPFHGRTVRGWVLGETDEIPSRMLAVKKAVSPVRFFDKDMLEVLRWVGERYVAPLASVIARSHPPRVASEEAGWGGGGAPPRGERFAPSARSARLTAPAPADPTTLALAGCANGPQLLDAIRTGSGEYVVRPAPDEEVEVAVETVRAALAAGRGSILLVPEASPLPATAEALMRAFGRHVGLFVGGDKRERYRRWLDIQSGRFACVVGTRPAVFAPVPNLGLMYVSRESHPAHREDRSPYYHVRDVALVRARLVDGVCVMSALCPSAEASVVGATHVGPKRRRWPPVEVVRPGPEGRAPRLVAALRGTRRGFLYEPVPGYGVAKVCRSCWEPAACAVCRGLLRAQAGVVRCAVCGADGVCAACGGRDFGVRRGGAERVEEWARAIAPVPVGRIEAEGRPPGREETGVAVGGREAVRDLGPLGLDLVGILDADMAARRPGLAAQERSLATWMEAAAWAAPDGRVIVQTTHPGDPAVQALVQGNPDRFLRSELPRRRDAGFPVGHPTFRVVGSGDLPAALERFSPTTLLVSDGGGQTVCLLSLDPERLAAFSRAARGLAADGVISRVEAEPHL